MFRAALLATLTFSLSYAQAMPRSAQASRQGQPPVYLELRSMQGETLPLTLSDAISLALRDNRSIRSAYLTRVAQKFDLRVAQDRFTPRLVLSASYLANQSQDDRYQQGTLAPSATLLTPYGTRVSLNWAYHHTATDHAGASRGDGASLELIQPLLRGAGHAVATAPVRLARLAEQANRLDLQANIAATITEVITAYRSLLQAQEQLAIARQSLRRAGQLIEINRALIDAGRMAEFEIVQTQAEVAAQELAFKTARNQVEAARLALLQLLAVDLTAPVVAAQALQAEQVEVDAAQALSQAMALQPAYLAQLIYREQAEINLLVARNERLWDVSLVGGASQSRERNGLFGARRNWENYAGVQLEIPIGDLGTRQAEVRAQVEVEDRDIRLADAYQQLQRDVRNAVRDLDTRWRQYEIAQRALGLTRRKLDIEREKLTLGRSSNFQVVSFENDLLNAENARLNALISYLNAQAELDRTLGTTLLSWGIELND